MKRLILAALLCLPFLSAAHAEEGKMADDQMHQGDGMKTRGATKPDATHRKGKKSAKKTSDGMKGNSMKQRDGMSQVTGSGMSGDATGSQP